MIYLSNFDILIDDDKKKKSDAGEGRASKTDTERTNHSDCDNRERLRRLPTEREEVYKQTIHNPQNIAKYSPMHYSANYLEANLSF